MKRIKSKEVGLKKLWDACTCLFADSSLKQEGHAQRQTLHHKGVESFDAGTEPSTFGEARSDPLQSARDSSLQEDGVVADLSEAEREAVEAREGVLESVWRMNVSSPRYAPRTSVCPERVIILHSYEIH